MMLYTQIKEKTTHAQSVTIDSNAHTFIVAESHKARPMLDKWLWLVAGFFLNIFMQIGNELKWPHGQMNLQDKSTFALHLQ